MKIVLAGTPNFSVPIFEEVIKNFNVVAIVSQPDRPANRGYKLEPTPTKLLAQKYNIPLFQPEKISMIYDELAQLDCDLLLTCAFGQFIPQKVLDLPKMGALNIHGSLLPKYRGAAPIQYSLLNGDQETGISLMYMTLKMDAGDVIKVAKLPILETDTSDTLFSKMSLLATENITKWLSDFQEGNFERIAQNESEVVLSPKLNKEDAYLETSLPKEVAFNKIRAFSSNPGAYIIIDNKRVKIFYASKEKRKTNSLEIKFSDGSLFAEDYQFESKKRVKL
ncbi:methionyl-tRNA formyltransferase [Mycoplasmopsis gallopavonis]|uniref:Methionyl-tRNA formyltransferase n=1 Tax=Mycoplasmopsis gallopavonis TaxID=76629 RepID=A0A449AZ73_9BACT|nr:methionyl-tRNA formyltransferase [Mycoplasmopsis gallopavonis]RIV16965.1 methionyl-tRNA formyltransferase [Mycoplasmopsis gallopavonis]VEU72787.1 Methionyl-tRNA formyltransferase [Mycoplasmopsis gallopavonis]